MIAKPGGIPEISAARDGDQESIREELMPFLETYEKALRTGEAGAPDQWLTEHVEIPRELQAELAELYWLFREDKTDQNPPTVAETALPQIPGYKILKVLSTGGMGVVYLARQLRPQREVVLKMIFDGGAASPEQLSRFGAESEALARLPHPNIVPVYDVGDYQGRPYFSMEFVTGGSLAKALAGTPLPAARAAQLVQTLAGAVHHAHGQGIVHRDLKPSNVLLAADGTPKITDFGLAKRLDMDIGQTRADAIVGTPSYMAPEQANSKNNEVGPAADVYSLGAILYELLTGRPPFKAATLFETLEQVREQEPVPVRRLQPKTPNDLETICLKCLQKDPRRRYSSAAELSADLTRFLAGEPIKARPVRAVGRLSRWCRRKPLAAGLIAALVTVFCIGLAAAMTQWMRAETEKDRNRGNLELALNALDEIYLQSSEQRLPRSDAITDSDREVLQRVLHFYEEFSKKNTNNAGVRLATAKALVRVGSINHMLGQYPEAEASFRQAIDRFSQFAADQPKTLEHRHDLVKCWASLATLYSVTNRRADMDEALTRASEALSFCPSDVLENRGFRETIARLHQLRGDQIRLELAEKTTGPDKKLLPAHFAAEREFRQSIDILKQLVAEYPDHPPYWNSLSQSYNGLAIHLRRMGRASDAKIAYADAQSLDQKLIARFPDNHSLKGQLANNHRNRAILLKGMGQPDEAYKCYQEARAILEQLVESYPAVPDYHSDLGQTLEGLTSVAATCSSLADRSLLLEKAIFHQRRAYQLSPTRVRYREQFASHGFFLSNNLLSARDHVGAARIAAEMDRMAVRTIDHFVAARVFADCVNLAAHNLADSEMRRTALARKYAGNSIKILRALDKESILRIDELVSAGVLGPNWVGKDCKTILQEMEAIAESR